MHTRNHVVDLSSPARRSLGLLLQVQMASERFFSDTFTTEEVNDVVLLAEAFSSC